MPGRRYRTLPTALCNIRSAFSTDREKAASIVEANVWSPRATATDGVWQAGSSTLSRNGLRTTTRITGVDTPMLAAGEPPEAQERVRTRPFPGDIHAPFRRAGGAD